MGKEANKTLIGGFVVGAIAILIVAVVAFASLDFLTKRHKYLMYFDGSVYGLKVGAPVTFRGVEVGEVIDVYMQFNAENESVRIPVLVEMGGAKVEIIDPAGRKKQLDDYRENHEKLIAGMIKQGLRGQLAMQSIVTGQLMVTLDFYPEKPARFVDIAHEYPEIPTIPTPVQMIQKTLRDLPIQKITDTLLSSLKAMERIVSSPELAEGLRSLKVLLGDVSRLVNNLERNVDPLASGMAATLTDARATLKETRKSVAAAQGAMKSADSMISGMKDESEGVAEMQYEFTTAMREFTSAAASFRVFIDYLERHPEILLRGKETSTEGQ